MSSDVADIVPDDVDAEELHRRKHATSTTPMIERKRCPACGTAEIFQRKVKHAGQHIKDNPAKDDHNYRCTKCGETFDDPVVGTAEEVDV